MSIVTKIEELTRQHKGLVQERQRLSQELAIVEANIHRVQGALAVLKQLEDEQPSPNGKVKAKDKDITQMNIAPALPGGDR